MLGYTQSPTVVRAPKLTDADGKTVEQRDWSAASRHVIRRVNIQPVGSSQQWGSDTRQVTSRWRLLTAQGRGDVDLTVGDHLEWNGLTAAVVGEPMRWPKLTGGTCHVEAVLESAPPIPGDGGSTSAGQVRAGTVAAAFGQGWTP